MGVLESLPRWWLSPELPGYRPEPEDGGTYSAFPYGDLPPVPDLDDDLAWLLEAPPLPESLAEAPTDRHPDPERPATAQKLEELVGETSLRLPQSFRTFVASEQPRSRIRSATYCYVDLGERLVPVGEGALVHFLSDQQWVVHWLLYCDADARECMVVSDVPFGFHSDDDPTPDFVPTGNDSAVCAESFSEFLYRFWIENEIWFALEEKERPLSAAEQAYVDHYAALGR